MTKIYRYILFNFLILGLLYSCNKEPNHAVRIENNTARILTDIEISGKSFQDLKAGITQEYINYGDLDNTILSANWGESNAILISININVEKKSKTNRKFTLSIDNVDANTGVVFSEFKED